MAIYFHDIYGTELAPIMALIYLFIKFNTLNSISDFSVASVLFPNDFLTDAFFNTKLVRRLTKLLPSKGNFPAR